MHIFSTLPPSRAPWYALLQAQRVTLEPAPACCRCAASCSGAQTAAGRAGGHCCSGQLEVGGRALSTYGASAGHCSHILLQAARIDTGEFISGNGKAVRRDGTGVSAAASMPGGSARSGLACTMSRVVRRPLEVSGSSSPSSICGKEEISCSLDRTAHALPKRCAVDSMRFAGALQPDGLRFLAAHLTTAAA